MSDYTSPSKWVCLSLLNAQEALCLMYYQRNVLRGIVQMNRIKKTMVVAAILVCFVASANAQSTLALQERCAEIVKKSLGEGGISRDKNGNMTSEGYTSHYNKKLDKCFVLMSWTTFTHTTKGEDQAQFSKELFNAIEQKEIGYYFSNKIKEGSS